MKPTLALSTCWSSHRHQDGYAMLTEMAELGFEAAELSHGVRITLVPGILRAVSDRVITITSTHNFCPLPTGVSGAAPNLYEPSSLDAREFDQWVRHTKRSVEFAAQVGARVLVCHLGRVRFRWFNPVNGLRAYLSRHPGAGVTDDPKYARRLHHALEKLRRRMAAPWAQVQLAVRQVLDHATSHGVRLGFENREGFDELPLDSDWAEFLGGFGANAPIGYWHDTGHAALKQRMGLLEPATHVARLAPWTLGFHLHDVDAGGHDHQPIGVGGVDFENVRRFWRPEHYLTLELSPRVRVDDVRTSKQKVETLR